MKILIAILSGIIFSVGLVVSGMVNPNKVIGFLDILGDWDYALAFVMGGAVIVNLILFPFILKKKPLCDNQHYLPTNKDVNKKLIIGSALFGIGWGLVGICPGPGIVNLVTLETKALVFVGAMISGMFVFRLVEGKLK